MVAADRPNLTPSPGRTTVSGMAITQKDIALRLKVSRQLVGLALTNHPSVAEATRKRIHEVAAELGYTAFANPAARALIARRYGRRAPTGIVAALLPSDAGVMRTMPFFAPYIDGLELEAFDRAYDLLFCLKRGEELPRLIANHGVDGVIVVNEGVAQVGDRLHVLGIPAVTLSLETPKMHCVLPDEAAGIRLAVEHLVALGHRRIAYLGVAPAHSAGKRRLDSFKESMRDAGLTVDPRWIEASHVDQSFEAAMAAWDRLAPRVAEATAVVCYNDLTAEGLVRRARATGIDVPGRLSVTGFDDTSVSDGSDMPITSIAYDRTAMGRVAVGMLFEESRKPRREVFPVTLVERGSTRSPGSG